MISREPKIGGEGGFLFSVQCMNLKSHHDMSID